MNKIELKFAISNLKKAVYYAECANKFKKNIVEHKIIEELKVALIIAQVELNNIKEKENE